MRYWESLVGVSMASEDSLKHRLLIWGPFLKSCGNDNNINSEPKPNI